MTYNMTDLRLPAEWEKSELVIMAWPHENTDWAYMLDDVRRCFINIVAAISHHAEVLVAAPDPRNALDTIANHPDVNISAVKIAAVDTNDTWARDFGPITLLDSSGRRHFLDFRFNGWGLKFASDRDNLITRQLHKAGFLDGQLVNRLGFVLEGGSIESNGQGLILTTSECLSSPNRNGHLSYQEITEYLKTQFSASTVLSLDHGALIGDDTDSHIDTLARLAPGDTILYVKCTDTSDPQFEGLDAMERQLQTFTTPDGRPFNLIGLPMPDPIVIDGERLPATYANFLVVNDAVLLPVYGQPQKDRLAEQMLRIPYPDHEIIPINCVPLIRQHGSLHCMTMQVPAGIL